MKKAIRGRRASPEAAPDHFPGSAAGSATLREASHSSGPVGVWSGLAVSIRTRVRGGLLVGIGYLLSPLSWWNDAALNIPLAWICASLVERLIPFGFAALFVAFYWLSNIAGFVLIHLGGKELFGAKISGRKWLGVLATTILYTLGILLLLKKKILAPLPIQL